MLALASFAATAALAAPVVVSGPIDGLEECGETARVRNYEVEPSVAASPDGSLIVGAWQQGRTATHSALAAAVGVSTDGGATWSRAFLPGISQCAGGQTTNASDPWVDVGPDGIAYVAALGVDWPHEGDHAANVVVYRSADQGQTWERRVVSPLLDGNDKETLTADPHTPGRAWVTWLRGADLFVARTDDGGLSWSAPARVIGNDPEIADPHIVALGGDRIALVYSEATFRNSASIWVKTSRDAGNTWSKARDITFFNGDRGGDADAKRFFRAPPFIFSTAAGPGGTAYFVVDDAGDRQAGRISVFRSRDGARSWRRFTVTVSKRARLLVATIAASPDGRSVGVVYGTLGRDRRGDDEVTVRYRLAVSRNRGKTWDDRPLTGTFDVRRAMVGDKFDRAIFIGDYVGLAPLGPGGAFGALVTAGPPLADSGLTDIVFAAR